MHRSEDMDVLEAAMRSMVPRVITPAQFRLDRVFTEHVPERALPMIGARRKEFVNIAGMWDGALSDGWPDRWVARYLRNRQNDSVSSTGIELLQRSNMLPPYVDSAGEKHYHYASPVQPEVTRAFVDGWSMDHVKDPNRRRKCDLCQGTAGDGPHSCCEDRIRDVSTNLLYGPRCDISKTSSPNQIKWLRIHDNYVRWERRVSSIHARDFWRRFAQEYVNRDTRPPYPLDVFYPYSLVTWYPKVFSFIVHTIVKILPAQCLRAGPCCQRT